jgi:uncharacterized protein (TIRG00374 family)
MRRLGAGLAIVGIGLAVAAPLLLGGTVGFSSLRNVAPHTFLILTGLSILSGLAKAGKLQILSLSLSQHVSCRRMLAIAFATDFAFLSSPAGAAGYALNMALLRNSGMSWSMATVVVSAEQALDLIFFAVAIPAAATSAAAPVARALPIGESAYIALFAAAALLALGLWCGRRPVTNALRNLAASIPWLSARRSRVAACIAEVRGQIAVLIGGPASRNITLLLLTTLQWLARYGALWLALRELGHGVPFDLVLTVQAVVLHLALWTGVPAGGGSADLGLAAALAPWVARPVIATALLLWRFSTLYVPLIIGFISLAALGYRAGGMNMPKAFKSGN